MEMRFIVLIIIFILSLSLNAVLIYANESKEADNGPDKIYESPKLNQQAIDLIEVPSVRAKLNFYPSMSTDEFRVFARNYELKPVIYLGYNYGNKREFDKQIINKYDLNEGDYILDAREEMGQFLEKYGNESFMLGHYTMVVENEKISYGEITMATSSNLTKSKIKDLLNDKRVYNMELGIITY